MSTSRSADRERTIVNYTIRVRLQKAARDRRKAEEEYRAALNEAIDAGWTNVAIGACVGVSDSAVRMWRKRREVRLEGHTMPESRIKRERGRRV